VTDRAPSPPRRHSEGYLEDQAAPAASGSQRGSNPAGQAPTQKQPNASPRRRTPPSEQLAAARGTSSQRGGSGRRPAEQPAGSAEPRDDRRGRSADAGDGKRSRSRSAAPAAAPQQQAGKRQPAPPAGSEGYSVSVIGPPADTANTGDPLAATVVVKEAQEAPTAAGEAQTPMATQVVEPAAGMACLPPPPAKATAGTGASQPNAATAAPTAATQPVVQDLAASSGHASHHTPTPAVPAAQPTAATMPWGAAARKAAQPAPQELPYTGPLPALRDLTCPAGRSS